MVDPFTAVDWCTAMMRHNVTDCLGMDDRGVRFGVNDRSVWSGVGDFSAVVGSQVMS